jgi:hypothetical protein
MKFLVPVALFLFFTLSCQNNSSPDEEVPPLIESLSGTWMDEDTYRELKVRDQEESWSTIDGIVYQINKDGTYIVQNDLEFGIPEGPGTWEFYPVHNILKFTPDASVDILYNLYWTAIQVNNDHLTFHYYRTKQEVNGDGDIQSNWIPRHFVR